MNYTYDALYRLTGETISGGSVNGAIGYTYDAVGNRLSRTSTVSPVPAATSTYDANDRLANDTYDNDGNTTASGGNTYAYDFENHLVNENSGAVSIVYDGDGNRVAKTVSGVTTSYLVDDRNLTGYAQVLEEISGATAQRVYTYGLNRITQSQASGTSFYGYDGLGSVRLLTDATGTVTDRYDYDAFGNIISQTGSTPNVYLYSGEQFDSSINLYYLRARYLSQSTGRFWTTDRLSGEDVDPVSQHKYAFAGNNPVNNSDPSGDQFLLPTIQLEVASSILSEIPELAPKPSVVQGIIARARLAVSDEGIRANRYMSWAELGRSALTNTIQSFSGTTYFTLDTYFSATTAKSMLALPKKPQVVVNLTLFVKQDALSGYPGTLVSPNFGEPGGGTEFYTLQPIPFWTRLPIPLPLLP